MTGPTDDRPLVQSERRGGGKRNGLINDNINSQLFELWEICLSLIRKREKVVLDKLSNSPRKVKYGTEHII